MMFSNLVSALRRLAPRANHPPQCDLLSLREFRQSVARERARSDRTGDRFCLLSVAPAPTSPIPDFYLELSKVLRQRLRLTDEAGWLDQQRVGIVLPATSPRGAWKLAADVCQKLNADHEPTCRVYCYPSDASQLDRSISDRRSQDEVPVQLESAADRPDQIDEPADALEFLFIKALPAWKRATDIVVATMGLVVALPVFLILAALIKLGSPGPVFFRQLRTGRGGVPFLIYKFRSMVVDAEVRKRELLSHNEQDGPAFKIAADPRVTRLGRFLRSTSLDELPQLWNVLRGDMSLVGPRPLPCDESNSCLEWQRRRLDVTPGLTGIWQVRGRGEATFNEWVRMDLEYIEHRSMWQDVRILAATVPAVVLRKGAR
jgi:lipopolysaccharide/colanic/teichoic acid biosynthesis glycosyltransferase